MTVQPSVSMGDVHDSGYVPVPRLIEEQAWHTPDRPAISYQHSTLTYAELDALAGGLAHTLAEAGVGRGGIVPVLMVNSLELPVSCIAVMKLGAVFVPLDPLWPTERLLTALAGLAPKVLLHGRFTPPAGHPGRAIDVDVRQLPRGTRRSVPSGPVEPVYGIFTSGTTGTPKCAINTHGGLANRFRFMTRYFRATGDEVVLQNSKHTFDSSLWQFFWPLTVGARSVLPLHSEFLDLHRTVDIIAEHRVTASDFVSSVFNALVGLVEGEPELLSKLESLRWLVVGSEPVNQRAVRTLTGLLPKLRVTNGYGPTETAIGMAFHPMSEADGDLVPLGRPIDNTAAAIVDDALNPVPTGELGEIMIGGACVGAGYFRAPVPTARAFVPNPLPQIAGDRVYLTGDLGRMDRHGRLFFVGRKDFQVKIGGMRIELDEIKAVAESCDGVRQAEVLVADEGTGKSLALFVACGLKPTEDELRAHLRRALPRTSLPSRIFALAAMPVNENAKADRVELRRLLDDRLTLDAARLSADASSTDIDVRVLRSMRVALHRPDLASDENFMDAGGDSLRALSVVNTIRAEFGVQEVCAQDLFDHPTAQRLALVVRTYQADESIARSEDELMAADMVDPLPDSVSSTALDSAPRTVLLTGVTGFVGSGIAREILAETDLRLICLVRAGDDARATRRLIDVLTERGWWDPAYQDRVAGIAADLALPRLALSAVTWDMLAETCDVVLHAGALVNFLYDYRAHRRANVLGTAELLRLATNRRPVPFHHVATLAALQSATIGTSVALAEDVDVTTIAPPPGGYNRSKWVAERMLVHARKRGAVVTVLRLGEVMPAADNGLPNRAALSNLLLSAFQRLGVRPDVDIWSDYTPVDYVSRRIVAATLDPAVWGTSLHIRHPRRVSFTRLLPEPTTVSCTDFVATVASAAGTQDRELRLLAALLPEPGELTETELRVELAEALTDNVSRYDNMSTMDAERRWGLPAEPLDDWLAAYRGYLRSLAPVARRATAAT